MVDNKLYICHEGELTLMETAPSLKLNLYDMNKQIISSLKPMTNKEITQKHKLIMDFYNKCKNNHWMLLCRDFNYYTLFEKSNLYNADFAQTIFEILLELGETYAIDMATDSGAIEIWNKPIGQESPLAFYLFPYDAGVVYYG